MREELTGRIKHLLNDSKFASDDDFRSALKDTLLALANYEEHLFEGALSELKNEREAEKRHVRKNAKWNVETRLLRQEELEDFKNLREIKTGCGILFPPNNKELVNEQSDESIVSPHFLRTSYENFCEIVEDAQKIYEGCFLDNPERKFSYRLQLNVEYVKKERILQKLCNIYNVEAPLIFSPYARRAVDIEIIEGLSKEDYGLADFCWKQNGLMNDDVEMIAGNILAWNIEVSEKNPESEGNKTDTKYYVYPYIIPKGTTSYILPDTPLTNIVNPVIQENSICIYTRKQLEDTQAELVTVYDTSNDSDDKNIFQCRQKNHLYTPGVLRTKGDAEAILQEFEMRPRWECRFNDCLPPGKGEEGIRGYREEHKYEYALTSDGLLWGDMRQRPQIVIGFKGELLFLTDYANYVLQYMREHFPLYRWAGVRL